VVTAVKEQSLQTTGGGIVVETVTLNVRSITCMACVEHIADAATRAGAEKVSGNVTQRTVKVVYDPVRVELPTIVRAIEAAGYRVDSSA
jgi:copper chaperone CopZ